VDSAARNPGPQTLNPETINPETLNLLSLANGYLTHAEVPELEHPTPSKAHLVPFQLNLTHWLLNVCTG